MKRGDLPDGMLILDRLLSPPEVEAFRRAWSLARRSMRESAYERTKPRADLCAFDAYGMDLIEGRI